MPSRAFHPYWSVVIYVLAGFAVLQWIIILPLAADHHLLTSLSCWIGDLRWRGGACPSTSHALIPTTGETRIVPFSKDFFFIAWNLFPILLAIAHRAIAQFYARHQHEIRERFRDPAGNPLQTTRARIRDDSRIIALLVLLLVIIAIWAQFLKEDAFRAEHTALYWWDLDISPTIFYVRLVFLATNVAVVGLALWSSFFGLIMLASVSKTHRVRVRVLDPMQCFGMQSFGTQLMLFITPWFMALIIAILGLYDNRAEQGALNLIGSLMIGALAIYGLFLIANPLRRVRREVERCRQSLLTALADETRALEEYLDGILRGDPKLERGVHIHLTPTYSVYQYISQSSSWPLPRTTGIPTMFSLVSPFFGAVGISASTILDVVVTKLA